MLLETSSQSLRKARLTNQTSASFGSRVSRLGPPVTVDSATGSYIFDLSKNAGVVQNLVKIMPYAVGSNNNTFSVRVIAWNKIDQTGTSTANPEEWFPVLLAELLCTISTSAPGIAGGTVSATEYFADTIAITYPATATSSQEVVSNGADLIAHVVLDMKGAQMLELSFQTGSSATSCNALLSMY